MGTSWRSRAPCPAGLLPSQQQQQPQSSQSGQTNSLLQPSQQQGQVMLVSGPSTLTNTAIPGQLQLVAQTQQQGGSASAAAVVVAATSTASSVNPTPSGSGTGGVLTNKQAAIAQMAAKATPEEIAQVNQVITMIKATGASTEEQNKQFISWIKRHPEYHPAFFALHSQNKQASQRAQQQRLAAAAAASAAAPIGAAGSSVSSSGVQVPLSSGSSSSLIPLAGLPVSSSTASTPISSTIGNTPMSAVTSGSTGQLSAAPVPVASLVPVSQAGSGGPPVQWVIQQSQPGPATLAPIASNITSSSSLPPGTAISTGSVSSLNGPVATMLQPHLSGKPTLMASSSAPIPQQQFRFRTVSSNVNNGLTVQHQSSISGQQQQQSANHIQATSIGQTQIYSHLQASSGQGPGLVPTNAPAPLAGGSGGCTTSTTTTTTFTNGCNTNSAPSSVSLQNAQQQQQQISGHQVISTTPVNAGTLMHFRPAGTGSLTTPQSQPQAHILASHSHQHSHAHVQTQGQIHSHSTLPHSHSHPHAQVHQSQLVSAQSQPFLLTSSPQTSVTASPTMTVPNTAGRGPIVAAMSSAAAASNCSSSISTSTSVGSNAPPGVLSTPTILLSTQSSTGTSGSSGGAGSGMAPSRLLGQTNQPNSQSSSGGPAPAS
ncbi:unnamed protein product [Protopolystoma xenopodis]|uniref:Uncharacterized protein n=1 Tax=Protopolystoma xenopodis TaxID=117903 RepID=A0A3S5AZK6_9PLAT|nr:unnamed protein product [Protopolystoma xenopodis]